MGNHSGTNSSLIIWATAPQIVPLHKQLDIMKLLLITLVLLGLAFAGIAIKIWGKKDGKFAGTCASQSPFLNKDGQACGMCGKMPDEIGTCDTKN